MVTLGTQKSLFDEAKKYIPGGVNSPVRSFRSVGGYPVFVKHASGSKFYGECGGEFIDYCLSWGALILGHAHTLVTEALNNAIKNGTSFGTATKLEIELAKLIVEAFPSIERIRLTSSGTEAVMSAIRLARAYTNKNKIIKFEGSYHGHADYLLTKAGSGLATLGIPQSPGVPKEFIKHTIVAPYNDIGKLEKIVKKYRRELAAIIVEPIVGNSGVILPRDGFLEDLKEITKRFSALLIFDEVITGFRISYAGAQRLFNVRPDITCLGKIIGGGLPIGAFGGKREIMEMLAPEGSVYQAGTLSGNPIAVTAGIAVLNILKRENPYKILRKKTKGLCDRIRVSAEKHGLELKINFIESMFSIFFTDKSVYDYKTAKTQNLDLFKRFFHGLLKEGIYFSPSGFETNFLSVAHSAKDIDKTLAVIDMVFDKLRRKIK